MGRLSKKLVSIVTSVALTSSIVFTNISPVVASASESEVAISEENNSTEEVSSSLQASKIENGVILHAWCWSFNEIKNHMAEIADAGYTSVQTSPAQACRMGKSWNDKSLNNSLSNPTWYYHYQPTYYTLGNYQLGSADEFEAMCDEAEKYGINIIVDIVGNHLADTRSSQYVDGDLLNNCHSAGKITNWQNRYQVTQGDVIGMPDLNTGSSVVQNKMISYLKELINRGADGFRFDAAKSIELPEESSGAPTSSYWTNIINAIKSDCPDAYIYGETLQGDEPGTNFPGYAKYMCVTGSTYGWFVRSAVGYEVWEDGSGNLGGNGSNGKVTPSISEGLTSKYMEGQVKDGSIPNTKIVSFVETHDTYANAGASRCLTQKQIQLAWAMCAAREGSVPLYFNRPTTQEFGGNYLNPQGEPYKNVGQSGSDDYKSKDVVEMNKFHNAMAEANAKESVSAINNNKVMKVERGNIGVVLVNVGDNTSINTSTKLPDGTYTNLSSAGGTFNVSNGKLSGNMSGSSIAILYKIDEPVTDPQPTISVEGGEFTGDSISVTFGLKNATSGTYKIGDESAVKYTSSVTKKIGSDLKAGESVTVKLTATDGKETTTKSYKFTKKDKVVSTGDVYIQLPSGWGTNLNCYIYKNEKGYKSWPGVAMTNEGNGLYSLDIPDGYENCKVIFNDGNNQYPGAREPGLDYNGTKMIYQDGKWQEYDAELEIKGITPSADSVMEGEKVTFTTQASGGTKPYNYVYTITGDDYEEEFESEDGSLEWNTPAKGNYNVEVKVTDSEGTEVVKSISYTVTKTDGIAPKIEKITAVKSGSKIKYTVTASGGEIETGLLFYKFYEVNSNGKEVLKQNYSLDNTFTTTATKIRVYVQNSVNDHIDTIYEYGSQEELTVSLESNKTNVVLGDSVELSATANNAIGTVSYKFEVENENGDVEVLKKYSSNSKIEWTPEEEGKYTVTVYAKDSDGQNDSSTVTINVTKNDDKELKITSYTAKQKSPQYKNTSINLSMEAEGEGDIEYKFEAKLNNKTSVIKRFNSKNTAVWTPTVAGTYTLLFTATDKTGKEVTETMTYVIKNVDIDKLEIKSISTDLASPQKVGTTIELSTEAVGQGTLKYRFVVVKDGINQVSRSYSTKDTLSWTPTEAGNYKLYFYVKDDVSAPIREVMDFNIVDNMTVNFTASKTSPQLKGQSIVLRANIANASSMVECKFTAIKDGKETTIQDYSSKGYTVWKPTLAGNYKLKLYVKESNGSVITKEMSYVIKDNTTDTLEIKSLKTNPQTSIELGTKVKIGATATGEGTLKYRFVVLKGSTNVYTKAYSTANYTSWKPSEEGEYTVVCKVKDSTGKEVSKRINVVVENSNVFAVKATTTNEGIKIVANNAVGEGVLQYRFVVLKDGKNIFTRSYKTTNSTTCKLTEKGTYTVICKVKDSTGKEISTSTIYTK